MDLSSESALETRKVELEGLKKEELISIILEKEQKSSEKKTTVQDLAKAILKDEDLIAASYETIAMAIRELMPEAKTSSKSIASYVSKKREEWELPQRIRITKA
jgi:hypothetical protein